MVDKFHGKYGCYGCGGLAGNQSRRCKKCTSRSGTASALADAKVQIAKLKEEVKRLERGARSHGQVLAQGPSNADVKRLEAEVARLTTAYEQLSDVAELENADNFLKITEIRCELNRLQEVHGEHYKSRIVRTTTL